MSDPSGHATILRLIADKLKGKDGHSLVQAAKEIDRLAEIERQVTWQPIEVAPKDGTVVLLRVPDPDVQYALGFWDDGWIDFAKVDHDDVRRIRAEGKEAPFVFGTPTYWLAFIDAPDAGEEG